MMSPGLLAIDLGMESLRAAMLDHRSVPVLVPDAAAPKQLATPAHVRLGSGFALVGKPAMRLHLTGPHGRLLRSVPRLPMQGPSRASDGKRRWPNEALVALLIKKIAEDARRFRSAQLGPIVVAIPDAYTAAERGTVRRAFEIVGLPRPLMLPHSLAAAAYLGPDADFESRHALHVSLDGASSSVAVVRASHNGHEVSGHAATGNGLRDITQALASRIESGMRVADSSMATPDPTVRRRIESAASHMMITLSAGTKAVVRAPILAGDLTYDAVMTRDFLHHSMDPMLDQVLAAAEQVLQGAGVSWTDLSQVSLVGSAVGLSHVQNRIRAHAQIAPNKFVLRQPEAAVVYGAAMWAASLPPEEAPSPPRTGVPFDIGLRTPNREGGADFKALLSAGAALPAERGTYVYVTRDGQTRVVVDVAKRDADGSLRRLGKLEIAPLQGARRNQRIALRLCCTVTGDVVARARHEESDLDIEQTLHTTARSEAARTDEWAARVRDVSINLG